MQYPACLPCQPSRKKWRGKNGGVFIDDIIDLLRILEPEAYEVWLASSEGDTNPGYHNHHRRFLLGTTIRNEMRNEVFSLYGPFKWKKAYGGYTDDTTKYFLGKEPDIRTLIVDIMFAPETLAKLEWENGGLSIDAIVAAFKEKHPDVYTLYKEAYYHKTDGWLRDLMQGRMHPDSSDHHKLGLYFTMRVTVDGKPIYKFFRGRSKPDLERSIVMAISNAELINQMVDSGVTMDEIVAALKEHSRVYTLYVQASGNGSERGLRTALGKKMKSMSNVVSREDNEGVKRYIWQQ